MPNLKSVVDEKELTRLLDKTKIPQKNEILQILKKSLNKKGLSLAEVAALLNTEDASLVRKMHATAGKIKNEIYGNRLVFFAPLYVSSFCINDCAYCGFHCSNPAPRKKLTLGEVKEQVKILESMGHKRLLLEFGEHPKENPIDYVTEVIGAVYATKSGRGNRGEIRRVNVNIAATTTPNYRKLKAAGIGTYQLFQETYHQQTYKALHSGPKADYQRQLFAHNRAFKAGIDDVGIGALFGLYDYRFDVLGIVSHAQYLDRMFGVGPHTISVPRYQPAETVSMKPPSPVSAKQLLKIIAILRMAVPYTGMIISTRESASTRAKAFEIGASQTSAASRTSPGGYGGNGNSEQGQFYVADTRDVGSVLNSVLKQGLLPSFCTSCYRKGRTGKSFMQLAKPGNIQQLCRPNAILTFKEYLEDYASGETKALGEKTIEKCLLEIENLPSRKETKLRLKRIENGERDLYF